MIPVKVQLVSHTKNPDEIAIAAAMVGTGDSPSGRPASPASVRGLAALEGASPLNHIVFFFGVEGLSRAALTQLTRHPLGSLNAQSQRYAGESPFQYSVPPSVEEDEQMSEIFRQTMASCQEAYDRLYGLILENLTGKYLASGGKDARLLRSFERTAAEEAGYAVPLAAGTRVVFSMSALDLIEFFSLRLCSRAPWEVRELAGEMLLLLKTAAPLIFEGVGPACMEGVCREGSLGCGRAIEIREKYSGTIGVST